MEAEFRSDAERLDGGKAVTGEDESPKISIELTSDEALVLFEWIARVHKDGTLVFRDEAEKQVLWDIECILEETLVEPLKPDYEKLVERARARVRDSSE
jgi:hypothetical protein